MKIHKMKRYFIVILILSFYQGYGQVKKKLTDLDQLNKCISEHTSYFTFDGQQPKGKGWDVLNGLFAQNQFVGWGEYHNSPLLSQLTVYALESAAKNGYKTWCVETGPFVAKELMRIAHSKSPADTLVKLFNEGYPQIGTFPFFSTKVDAKMLAAVNAYKFTIWGIDQEFQMSFSYLINKVYAGQSKGIREHYKTVYDSLVRKWWNPETKLLDSLIRAIPQKYFKKVLNDIKLSKEIYNYGDNAGRASLMKSNFFNYYDAAAKNEKVFFKMGSNHLAKGINLYTQVYDIGNAVYELAERNKTKFANVYIMARYTTEKGKIVDDLESEENENPKVFSKLYDKDKWILVDVSALKPKMKHDNSLPHDAYQIIEKYDYVLVSPEIMKE